MRVTPTAIAGLAVVAALAGTATADSTADRATGGGQILLSTSGRGAGDTVAFTAQQYADGTAKGQVQVIDRTDGAGHGVRFHADVTCVDVEGNVAKLAGTGSKSDGTTTGFTMVVTDNGEGAQAGNDTIALQYTNDPTCDRQDGDDDSEADLARGNAQVTDGH